MLVRCEDLDSLIQLIANAQQQAIAAMVARRHRLLTVLVSERQRLQLEMPMVRPNIEAMIESIRARSTTRSKRKLPDMCASTTGRSRSCCARPAASTRLPAPP
ncbi:hypothetical protein Tchl_3112 [Thauera chlorobenzoica]|uniref:Uncharacterized protein n=1 Tax=Thauera chlorobenzoica TaxID=96773 RepID=A0A1L6FG76_9RHOO|nr:hypothetical protein Tchl_3112 [Thauera chlorobenzoica]